MIAKTLKKAFEEKTLIGIKTNAIENDESIIGFLLHLDEISFKINEIDEYGFFIGSTVIATEDVISIETDDRYHKRLKFIHDNCNSLKADDRITVWQKGKRLIPYLNEILNAKSLSTFYLNQDNYITGYLLKINETQIKINNIGHEGDEDGTSYHFIENLIGLKFKSLEEQKIELLYKNRQLF